MASPTGRTTPPHPPLSTGAVVEAGVRFDPKDWRAGTITPMPGSLPSDVERLLAALDAAGAGHVLVGGVAVLSYVAGRDTQDIGLLFDPAAFGRVPGLVVEEQDRNFATCRFGSLRVDLLLATNPFFAMVRDRHATVRAFAERAVPCATAERLVLLKLYALPSLYRQGGDDRRGLFEHDVVRLVEEYRPDMDALFRELEPYMLVTDVAELKQLVADLLALRARSRRFDDADDDAGEARP